MLKQKLINKRKEMGITQEEIAFKLGIEQSQYSRRENGITKISTKEWESIAEILDTDLNSIYEPDNEIYVINNENAKGNFGNYNTYISYSEKLIETMSKYIEKLEDEINLLKSKKS